MTKLRVALRALRARDPRCDTFGRLWGAFSPEDTWPESTLDLYLLMFGGCRRLFFWVQLAAFFVMIASATR